MRGRRPRTRGMWPCACSRSSPDANSRTVRPSSSAPSRTGPTDRRRALPAAGLDKPIWEYDATTLAWDLGAHLAYGAGTGTAFWLLTKTA